MRGVMYLIAVLGCFGLLAHSSRVLGQITVDFSGSSTAVTHRASGFISKFNKNYPGPDLTEPTKPQLIRGGVNEELLHDIYGEGTSKANHDYVKGLGADIQILLGNFWWYTNIGGPDYEVSPVPPQKWPGDGGDWSEWDGYVTYHLNHARTNGFDVQWDIWNEPDTESFDPSGDRLQRLKDTYAHTYDLIRAYDTTHSITSTIVFPSNASYEPWWAEEGFNVAELLSWADSVGKMPDIAAWHEWTPDNVRSHVPIIKAAHPGVPISINEYSAAVDHFRPGRLVDYYAALEEAGVDTAARAGWNDPETSYPSGTNLGNHSLNGLLVDTGSAVAPTNYGFYDEYATRSVYWVAKGYGDITGELVNVASSDPSLNIVGLAGIDSSVDKAVILVGRDGGGGSPSVNLELSGLASFNNNGSVHVLAQHIPDYGGTSLSPQPLTSIDTIIPVIDGAITLPL